MPRFGGVFRSDPSSPQNPFSVSLSRILPCRAIEGLVAELFGLSPYSHFAIPYWNAAMIFGFYLAATERSRSSAAEEIKTSVLEAVEEFSQGDAGDDLALLCIAVNGGSEGDGLWRLADCTEPINCRR